MATKSKNEEVLTDFVEYCKTHPTERFFQALRNFSGYDSIFIKRTVGAIFQDTFYFEGLDKGYGKRKES